MRPEKGPDVHETLDHGHSPRYLSLKRVAAADIIRLILLAFLVLLVVTPLLRLLLTTLGSEGREAWSDVVRGRLAPNLLWEPLRNTVAVGALVALFTVVVGGLLAWLVVMTDMPGRRIIGALASIPYIIPSFAIALAWQTLFQNDRLGGRVGLFQELGFAVPDWLAWGFVPVTIVLSIHYFSLGFMLISAALASINSELLEAAAMTGAGKARVLKDITFRVVTPAVMSSILLSFGNGVSNFAAPAILGLPVRFEVLSTRIFGMIRIGQTERGFVLTVILILIAALLLWFNTRLIGGRRSFATLTGKAGRRKRQALGAAKWPLLLLSGSICFATTVLPLLALIGSSLTRRTGSFTGGLTLHYWIGRANPSIAQGQEGVLRNPQVAFAAFNTIGLGLSVALAASLVGLLIGYVAREKRGAVNRIIESFSYIPFFIPGIAFGAAYIALFGRPIGPFPSLYGTFTLLVIAAAAYNLPFAAQAGRATVSQIAEELEEAAIVVGAGLFRRLVGIVLPLAARGLFAGAVLVFVKIVRDLSLVILLVTPVNSVLSVVAFQYSSEGFAQFANAITVIIATISVVVTLWTRRLQGATQPWAESA